MFMEDILNVSCLGCDLLVFFEDFLDPLFGDIPGED